MRAEAGDVTVWSPFRTTAPSTSASGQQLMVNYRVSDLDAMLEQLRAAGVEVVDNRHEDENGRFGWAVDPEGNRIELWQPPAVANPRAPVRPSSKPRTE